MNKAVPLLCRSESTSTLKSEETVSSGTGFFFYSNNQLYLITNRHNIRKHKKEVKTPQRTYSHKGGSNENFIHILNLSKFPGIYPKSEIADSSFTKINLDKTKIKEEEDFDVAIIKINGFRPDQGEFYVFNEFAKYEVGDNLRVSG